MPPTLTELANNFVIRPRLQFLVKHKYPGVRLDLNLNLIFWEDHDYDEQKCQLYLSSVLAMTETQLINECEELAELKDKELLLRLPKPDYPHWNNMVTWSLSEAICLVFGINPDIGKLNSFIEAVNNKNDICLVSPLAKNIYNFTSLTTRKYLNSNGYVSPSDFITWAIAIGIKPPVDLIKLINPPSSTDDTMTNNIPILALKMLTRSMKIKIWQQLADQIIVKNPNWNKSSVADEVWSTLKQDNSSSVMKKNGKFYPVSTIERNINMKRTYNTKSTAS